MYFRDLNDLSLCLAAAKLTKKVKNYTQSRCVEVALLCEPNGLSKNADFSFEFNFVEVSFHSFMHFTSKLFEISKIAIKTCSAISLYLYMLFLIKTGMNE